MEDLNDLMIFAKVVETQSFTLAAEALTISRALVSKRVSRLEAQMGVQLLQRTTRRLHLTQAGLTLHDYCRQLQQTLTDAEQAMGNLRGHPHGPLKVTASVTFGQMYLADMVAEFLAQYPQVEFRLSLSDSLTDLVAGGFDLAVRIGRLADSSLRARKVGQTRILVLAHPEYLARHPAPQHPRDLAEHNCLTYKHLGDREDHWAFMDGDRKFSVKVAGNFSADNGMPLLKAAARGLGIAYVPDFMLSDDLDSKLVRLLPEYCRVETGIYTVYPNNKQPSLNTRVFIDYLSQAFAEIGRAADHTRAEAISRHRKSNHRG